MRLLGRLTFVEPIFHTIPVCGFLVQVIMFTLMNTMGLRSSWALTLTVFFAFALVTLDRVVLYVDTDHGRLLPSTRRTLPEVVEIQPYDQFYADMAELLPQLQG